MVLRALLWETAEMSKRGKVKGRKDDFKNVAQEMAG